MFYKTAKRFSSVFCVFCKSPDKHCLFVSKYRSLATKTSGLAASNRPPHPAIRHSPTRPRTPGPATSSLGPPSNPPDLGRRQAPTASRPVASRQFPRRQIGPPVSARGGRGGRFPPPVQMMSHGRTSRADVSSPTAAVFTGSRSDDNGNVNDVVTAEVGGRRGPPSRPWTVSDQSRRWQDLEARTWILKPSRKVKGSRRPPRVKGSVGAARSSPEAAIPGGCSAISTSSLG